MTDDATTAPGAGVGDGAGGDTPPSDGFQIPEAYKDRGWTKDVKSVEDLFKMADNLVAYQGRSIALPSEDAGEADRKAAIEKVMKHFNGELMPAPNMDDAEAREKFFRALGTPEKADGYMLPKELPVEIDDARLTQVREAAIKANLTADQFQQFVAEMAQADKAMMEQLETTKQEEVVKLRNEWGRAFDERMQLANKFIADRMPGTNPDMLPVEMIKGIYEVAKIAYESGDGNLGAGGQQPGSDVLTPAEAQERINELWRNEEFVKALHTPSDPGHQAAKKKMERYYEMMNDQGAKDPTQLFGVGVG